MTAAAQTAAPASVLAAAGPVSLTDLTGVLSRGVDVAAACLLSSYRRNFSANFTGAVLSEFDRIGAQLQEARRRDNGAAGAAGVVPAQFAGAFDEFEANRRAGMMQAACAAATKRLVHTCTRELALIKELLIKQQHKGQQAALPPQQQQQHRSRRGGGGAVAVAAAAGAASADAAALPALAQLLAAAAWWGVLEGLQALVSD